MWTFLLSRTDQCDLRLCEREPPTRLRQLLPTRDPGSEEGLLASPVLPVGGTGSSRPGWMFLSSQVHELTYHYIRVYQVKFGLSMKHWDP